MQTDSLSTRILTSRDALLAFIRSRGVAEEDAEDILQESLLRALQNAPELRDEDRLTAWLYQIVRNAIADHYRRRNRDAVATADGHEPASADDHRLLCRCIDDVIPLLPEDYAEVVRAVELEGESTTSAAARLGITRNNLKVRLHRARAQLRQRLEDTCRSCAEHGCLDCACRRPATST